MSSFKNQEELKKAYPADKYIHFMPFENLADTLSPYFKVTATVIRFDLDPGHNDVYEQESARVNKRTGEIIRPPELAFSKGAIETLAAAAGIRDVASGCGVQIRQSKLCTFQATGESRMPDGSYRQVSRTYTVDLELFEDQQRAKKTDQARKVLSGALDWKSTKKEIEALGVDVWVENKVRDIVNQKRGALDETAETGAKQRMIRAILKVPNKFTADEMARPVVVLRVDEDFPVDDPDFKRIIAERGSRSISALYPPGPAPATSRGDFLPNRHHESGNGAPAGGIELGENITAERRFPPPSGPGVTEFLKTTTKGTVIEGETPSKAEVYETYDAETLRDMFVALIEKKEYDKAGKFVIMWKATCKSDTKKRAAIIVELENWENPAGNDNDLPF